MVSGVVTPPCHNLFINVVMRSNLAFFLPVALMVMSFVSGCSGRQTQSAATDTDPEFVTVKDGQFYIGDSVYRFVGTNMWYAPILASQGTGGDRARLAAELDTLEALGITNLRILVGADGPEGRVAHISPVLQTAPGVYDPQLLEGLDYLLQELERRDMKAVLYLTNSWEWSGGFSAYLEWAGEGEAKIPAVDGYMPYCEYVSQFTLNDSTKAMFDRHVRNIVGRTNSLTGRPYAESPAIMSWQISNEPRAFAKDSKPAFEEWIKHTAALIKEIDPNHLVSTGSEGLYGCEVDLDLWTRIHSDPNIDYATIHIWPSNWGWTRNRSEEDALANSIAETDEYIRLHVDSIAPYGRPLVIEEFGYPRDGWSTKIDAGTVWRDRYFTHLLSHLTDSATLQGVNVWAWGGSARPVHDEWQAGDDYMGDPAQEPQGLFSVMTADSTTIVILSEAARKVAE